MSEPSQDEIRWMVGVDARELSRGAIAYARWLAGGRFHRVYGAHVVEWVPHVHERYGEVGREQVRAMATKVLEPLDADPRFEELGAVLATGAEDGLVEAVQAKHAHALVIGPRAPRDGGVVIRLGRVARRLVRRLPVPVVVVPPDLEPDQIGDGPVVLGVDLTESCGVAAAWAARVAADMRRSLVLVHAIHLPDDGPYLPSDMWEHSVAVEREHGAEAFRAWADRHGVGATEQVLLEGPPVQVLPRLAQERRACLLVTGSRELGGMERLFLSSLGTELAATAPLPVAIVPPS